MSAPGIPESQTITDLRRALDGWHSEHGVGPASATAPAVCGLAWQVVDAADALIREYDGQLAYIKLMTEQAISREQIDAVMKRTPGPYEMSERVDQELYREAYERTPGQVKGTLDP